MARDQQAAARILIVEDALGIAEALQRALTLYKDGSYHVEVSDSGEAALKLLVETPFDLLITDLRLPGMDGLELLERARHLGSAARTLLITAYGSPEVEAQARQQASAYLAKPFALRDLLREVELLLNEPIQVSPPVSEGEDGRRSQLEMPAAIDRKKVAHFKVLAFDLDGTLAEQNQVAPQTWDALRTARLVGHVLILVTGRTLDSFISEFPFAELCEALVVENGAALYFPRRDAVMLPFGEVDAAIFRRLHSLDIPLVHGMAIAATQVPHDAEVFRVLQAVHAPLTVEYNRSSVMLLPPGASKGQGLMFALQELGYSSHNLLVCGDAENDRTLFDVAELSVAVANAEPALKARADAVLEKRDGEGVQTLIGDLLNGNLPNRRARPARFLHLGHRMSGATVSLDPFNLVETNLGIFGSSGSGKSWLAGLLVEEMLKQKYQVCIIDPEGDYRSLGISPNTLLLGGPEKALPPAEDLNNLLEWKDLSLVLDLSMYSLERRARYIRQFLGALKGLRSRRGRPHFLVVDEAQIFCPSDGGLLTDEFVEIMQLGGLIAVSYRLSQLAPGILDNINNFLVTRLSLDEELGALQPQLERLETGIELDQLRTLPTGYAYACLEFDAQGRSQKGNAFKFRVGPRSIPHVRHLFKYLRAPLPEWKRFYFHYPDGRFMGRVAGNLWEFREALGEVPLDSLAHHLWRGDFENWLRGVLHDEELARRVRKVADRQLEGEALRQALLEVVIARYDELETYA